MVSTAPPVKPDTLHTAGGHVLARCHRRRAIQPNQTPTHDRINSHSSTTSQYHCQLILFSEYICKCILFYYYIVYYSIVYYSIAMLVGILSTVETFLKHIAIIWDRYCDSPQCESLLVGNDTFCIVCKNMWSSSESLQHDSTAFVTVIN